MPRAHGNDGSHSDKSHVKIRPIAKEWVHRSQTNNMTEVHWKKRIMSTGLYSHFQSSQCQPLLEHMEGFNTVEY